MNENSKVWSMQDEKGREELVDRVRRAAHKIARGPQDYEDTVQDMVLVILEAQAEDPNFAAQAPSFQVKRAWWRVRDLRRRGDRETVHLHLDQPISDDSDADWYELIAASGPADQPVFEGLTRAEVRSAIESLAADEGDTRGSIRRELIVRRFYGEQTVAQASEALGIPKGTGCMYSAQALKQLKGKLEAWA